MAEPAGEKRNSLLGDALDASKDSKDSEKLAVVVSRPSLNDASMRQKWYQWFSPTDTAEERRLILKLDFLILPFVMMAYFSKILDTSTTSTAYVSGMKEALHLNGNELNYFMTTYTVGFIVCQVPLMFLMTKISAAYILPLADVTWGLCTLVQYKVTNAGQMYACRFLIGTAGGFLAPAVSWYLGCWYKKSEIYRRGALFYSSATAGAMSSGIIQAAIHRSLDGKLGLEGWRWLYIICFCATIPIAFLGFICLPGTPEKPGRRFLSAQDISLAQARMASEHREPSKGLSFAVIKEAASGWKVWLLILASIFFTQADSASINAGFRLWLKAAHKSIEDINNIGSSQAAVAIIWTLFTGVMSDAFDARVSMLILSALANTVACIILAIWEVSDAWKYFSFLVMGTGFAMGPLMYTWANEICANSAEQRAFAIGAMSTIGHAFSAWLPLLVWKTTDAPRYHIGYLFTIGMELATIGMVFVLWHLWNRQQWKLAA